MLDFYLWLIVQIVLEGFPVSSSGHVSLVELCLQRLGYSTVHASTVYIDFLHHDFIAVNLLEHLVHGVTVALLVLFFYTRWTFLVRHVSHCWRIVLKIIGYTFAADCMTALFYILFQHHVRVWWPLGVGFFITACALYSLHWCTDSRRASFTLPIAVLLGATQGMALLPGISRFGLTYVVARWCALPAHKAFEISFLMQWPLILVAFLHSLWVVSAHAHNYFFMQWHTLGVMVCAGIVAFVALKGSAYLSATNRLGLFAYYMVIPITAWVLLIAL